ncbi:MAG: glycosyltransferase family 4 protein [Myxococcaceae bacterium]|nr:glycosyltransferase family 4 protein [Myxococcaceae bacterium]
MQTHGKLNTATLGLRKSIWAVRSLRDRGISRTLISLKRELASSDEKATSWWEQWPYRWIDQCAEAPRPRPLRRTPPDPAHLEINWVIPGFSRGSGGHMTIFRMVSYLERFGHKQRVYIQDPAASGLPSQPVHLQALVQDWFLPIQSPVLPLDGEMEPADIAMATGWTTAYSVRQTQCAPVKVYFIQDYESSFYPAGSESQFAENTYHFGFYAITAGRWLERLMRDQYKMVTRSFPLAVEHRDFWPQAEKRSSSPKVVAYIRPATPRRAYELVALALRRIHQAVPDVEIHVLGAELGPSALPVPFVSHGIIGTSEMRRLFSACDVGICVSMTNYSLLPQEMAACGCAVVDLDGDNNRTVYPPGAIALAEPTPEGLAGEVIRLLKDPVALHQQKSAGLDYVRTLSWEKSARLVEAALREFALGAQDEDSPRVAREAAGTRQH